jgi:hypothetical protein
MPDRLTDEQLLQLQGGLLAIGGMFGGEVGEALHKLTEAAHELRELRRFAGEILAMQDIDEVLTCYEALARINNCCDALRKDVKCLTD